MDKTHFGILAFFLQILGILLHRIFPSNSRHFTTLRFLSFYGTKQTRINEALLKGAFRALDAYKPKEVKRFRKISKGAKIQKVPRKSAENRDVFLVANSILQPALGLFQLMVPEIWNYGQMNFYFPESLLASNYRNDNPDGVFTQIG